MLKPRFSSFALAGFLTSTMAFASGAMAQAAAKPAKVLTPEERHYQARLAQWRAEREALRVKATNALNAEMQHTGHPDCPDAVATRDAEICLDQAFETAQKNYAAFTSALRSMLGTDQVAEFDELESLSKKYREAASSAAYDQFKGGTYAPVFAIEAKLKLLRSHLQELSFIYDGELAGR